MVRMHIPFACPVCGSEIGRGAVPHEEHPRHLVDPPVCGLGREDRRNQQFERGREIQLDVRIRVQPGQLAVDPARSPD